MAKKFDQFADSDYIWDVDFIKNYSGDRQSVRIAAPSIEAVQKLFRQNRNLNKDGKDKYSANSYHIVALNRTDERVVYSNMWAV